MKQKLLITLMFLLTWGTGSVLADIDTSKKYFLKTCYEGVTLYLNMPTNISTAVKLGEEVSAVKFADAGDGKYYLTSEDGSYYLAYVAGSQSGDNWTIKALDASTNAAPITVAESEGVYTLSSTNGYIGVQQLGDPANESDLYGNLGENAQPNRKYSKTWTLIEVTEPIGWYYLQSVNNENKYYQQYAYVKSYSDTNTGGSINTLFVSDSEKSPVSITKSGDVYTFSSVDGTSLTRKNKDWITAFNADAATQWTMEAKIKNDVITYAFKSTCIEGNTPGVKYLGVNEGATGNNKEWVVSDVTTAYKWRLYDYFETNNGVATGLVQSADCSATTGWTNAGTKGSQTNCYGSSVTLFEKASTDAITQTLSNMPAGTYLLQAVVRGGSRNNNMITVAIGGASVVLNMKDGDSENTSGTAWTASLAEAANTGAYKGWLKAEVSVTTASTGDLTISLTPSTTTWTQICDVKLFKTDAATFVTKTRATTDATTTYVDLSDATTFSLFDLGTNKNVIVKAATSSAIASMPNVVVDGTCANLVLTDGAYSFGNTGSEFTATSATYDRSFTKDKFVTLCLPFAVSADECTNGTLYTLTSYSDNSLNFSTVTSGSSVDAYTPCLYKATTTGKLADSFSSKTIIATPGTISTTQGDASFIGTMASGNIPADSYFISDNTLYKASDNSNTINPFRGYFTISGSSPVKALAYTIDDETTGIMTIDANGEVEMSTEVYDLNGRRVSKPTRGLYIVNGKKVILK